MLFSLVRGGCPKATGETGTAGPTQPRNLPDVLRKAWTVGPMPNATEQTPRDPSDTFLDPDALASATASAPRRPRS